MSWALPGTSVATSKLIPLYQEPLDNWYGDIPEQFVELKQKAQRAAFDIEEVIEKLNEILETDDPERALEIADELDHEYGRHIWFQDGLFDGDFYTVVKQHKERHDNLQSAGILDLYFKLQKDCSLYICSNLAKYMPIGGNTAYLLTISYDPKDLAGWTFSADLKEVEGLFVKKEGEHWLHKDAPFRRCLVCLSWLFGRIHYCRKRYMKFENGEWIEEPDKNWEEKLETVARIATREIIDRIYYERFGE